MEIKKEVKTYRVIMKCDKCKQGEMKPTNMGYLSFLGQYEHQCDCCGYRTSYNCVYPTIVYEEEPEKKEEKGAKDKK